MSVQATPEMPDVTVENHGSLFVFRLGTEAAEEWVAELVDVPDHMWMGAAAFACEHSFAANLASGMVDDGLLVR